MEILPATSGINRAITILHDGGIVAHATETCYGLACDLTNPDAVKKLFVIKERPLDLPVSALFPSVEEAKKYVKWNALAQEQAEQYLPGPLTLILPLNKTSPYPIFTTPQHQNSTIGIRVSSHPIAHQLTQEFGKPISTTSANIHGEPNPYSIKDLAPCDFILDSGTLPLIPPSKVIDCTGEQPKTLRNGGVARHVPLPTGGD